MASFPFLICLACFLQYLYVLVFHSLPQLLAPSPGLLFKGNFCFRAIFHILSLATHKLKVLQGLQGVCVGTAWTPVHLELGTGNWGTKTANYPCKPDLMRNNIFSIAQQQAKTLSGFPENSPNVPASPWPPLHISSTLSPGKYLEYIYCWLPESCHRQTLA